jgi:hypothetical protein
MPTKKIENITWYEDAAAKERGEPGVYHSFVASLATALDCLGQLDDPAWLMGASTFAFRSFVNQVMCPSAMSIFNWRAVLPEAVEQLGRRCTYISRLWGEDDIEEARRTEAQGEIRAAIDRGVPAIVWDIHVPEWGLIIGYDNDARRYHTLGCDRRTSTMGFDELGQRDIKILSVAIPGEPNSRSRREVVLNSLKAAVAHARQQEWMDRPKYQDGLPAMALWASIIQPGHNEKISFEFSQYYAGHHYSARCYARDYLAQIADGDKALEAASVAYAQAASCLKPVWEAFYGERKPADRVLSALAQRIRESKAAEEEAVGSLAQYLDRNADHAQRSH